MSECSHLERTHLLADGELSELDAAAAREHVATCAECQAELADIVQLDLAVAEAPKRLAPIVSLAWYRRRTLQVAAAAVAAAAALAVFVATRKRGEPRPDAPVQVALAEKRAFEVRLSWGATAAHREYDVPRAADAAREPVALSALAELEHRGDAHGVGVLAMLDGDRRRAAEQLAKAGDSADVLADRAALAIVDGTPDRALGLVDTALAKQPGHPGATWNRALALRDLGLVRAAAAAFREVAKRSEPGWAAEAKARAEALDRDADARRDHTLRIYGAGGTLASDGTGLTIDDVRAVPGSSRLMLYDAVRAAPSAERVAKLMPLFEALGPDAAATAKRIAPRPELAGPYAAMLANKPPAGPALAKYLAALRAARDGERIIGTLVYLAPTGTVSKADLPEVAKLAAASPDPWFRLLGLEQQAQVAFDSEDLPRAEALLLPAREQCKQPAAPAYRCIKIATLLVDVYRTWQRLAEARAVLGDAWASVRRGNEWFLESRLLQRFISLAVAGDDVATTGAPIVAAYAEEQRLRAPDDCQVAVFTRVSTANVYVNQLRLPDAARELAQVPACKLSPDLATQLAFVRAHLVRESGTAEQLAQLRADIAKLRDDPATPPAWRIVLDHAEGRAVIDRDPAAGEALLRRAIAAANAFPSEYAMPHKAAGWSYAVLAIAAAHRKDGAAALAVLAEEQGVTPSAGCVLGLALDDQRRIAVARDVAGALHVHYDEDRRTPAVDGAALVPSDLRAALGACPVVDVIARSPIHGMPRLLDAVAWRYLSPRAKPAGSGSDRELVVAGVEPPAALALPKLAPWTQSRGALLAGAAATPSRVLAAMGEAGVVTIHAHGMDLGQPDASFLALSPEADGRYALTAKDVHAAQLASAPLVILAACRASQEAPVLYETWSLPVAFVHAGARAVIASASPIPDAEAPAFFDDVVARVTSGSDPAMAVREAREQWLSRGRGSWVRDVIVFE